MVLVFASTLRTHTFCQIDTHTQTHCKETFHDIIGFIRSRPKQESGPLAGLLSMLGTADRNTVLLLPPHLSLSVGLSQHRLKGCLVEWICGIVEKKQGW